MPKPKTEILHVEDISHVTGFQVGGGWDQSNGDYVIIRFMLQGKDSLVLAVHLDTAQALSVGLVKELTKPSQAEGEIMQ